MIEVTIVKAEGEVINQDPYGDGWLAVIEASDWPADPVRLLSPEGYFELMKLEVQEGVGV